LQGLRDPVQLALVFAGQGQMVQPDVEGGEGRILGMGRRRELEAHEHSPVA
jgi:hypothetical protein